MAVDKKMRILVVDDFKTMVRVVESMLKQMGFETIDTASNGQEALKLIKEKKYQLILSDWNMEPMSGMELLKAVRADPELKLIPFILITAESKVENIVAAKKAGVNNYIVKPFNLITLKEKLSTVIGNF